VWHSGATAVFGVCYDSSIGCFAGGTPIVREKNA